MKLQPHACERAVGRVLDYLARSGVELTPAAVGVAFTVVHQALAAGDDRVVERALETLPRHFALPCPPVPAAAPRIQRASIGYG